MSQETIDQGLLNGSIVKMGSHYFYSEDVAKTLLPRINEIEVTEEVAE